MLMEGSILETKQQVLIIGGGVFGLTAAIVLGEAGIKVIVVEKEQDIMLGASLVNQNRIHYGYHYPRSKDTCLESLEGLDTFKDFYNDSIFTSFKKFYAIAKEGSHINADQFHSFCTNLGLHLEEAYPDEAILRKEMVEQCWLTYEPIFDYNILKKQIIYRVSVNKNITVLRNVQPVSIQIAGTEKIVKLSSGQTIVCDTIVNATYASISETAQLIGQEPIPAKYQLCLLPILSTQKQFNSFGITIMDGPFCSLMPKGISPNQFILYHVKHSVLETHVGDKNIPWMPIKGFPDLDILEHSKQFFPLLDDMELIDSWITTRIVLPQQEIDDARPTLTIQHGNSIYSLFSGKLTTCVSAAKDLLKLIQS